MRLRENEPQRGIRVNPSTKKLKGFLSEPIKNGYSPICVGQPTSKKVLGLGALTGSGLNLDATKYVSESNTEVDNFLIKRGDFLISRSNTLDKVGRAALYESSPKNISCPDLMMKFRVDEKKIDPRFLELILQSYHARKHFMRYASGTSGSMVKITKSVVESLEVPSFSLGEQKGIVNFVFTWKEAIEKIERLIAAKEKQLNALYQSYFRPSSSENKNWQIRRIGEFVKVRKERSVPTEEMPLYSLTIEDGVTAKTDRYNREFLVKDQQAKTYKVAHPRDIVFNPSNLRWGAIARSEVPIKVTLSPIYEILEVNDNLIDNDFLTHAITCPRQIGIFATKVEGTLIERMAVKVDVFQLCEILVPQSVEEQQRVAEILNIVKRETRILRTLAEKCRTQKRGLMQKLLTEEWRISC